MTREELLEQLLVERYAGEWWVRPTRDAAREQAARGDELAGVRRRRDAVREAHRDRAV